MRMRTILPLILGVAAGGLALWLGYEYVQREKGRVANRGSGDMRPIVVAREEIPVATPLVDKYLEVIDFPVSTAEKIGKKSVIYSETAPLIGRVSRIIIPVSQPICESLLAPEGSAGGMAPLIPKGFRACTIRINEQTGVAGFIKPGSIVDVIASIGRGGRGRKSLTKTILQNVKVLAIGQELQVDETTAKKFRSATLLVRPENAERLALVSGKGLLQLILRSDQDKEEIKTDGVTLSGLFEGDAPSIRPPEPKATPAPAPPPPAPVVIAPPPPPKPVKVEVFKAGEKTEVIFKRERSGSGGGSSGSSPPLPAEEEPSETPPQPLGG